MTVRNADNERIKRKYLIYFKEAKRYSEQTVDASAKAIHRFEVYTKHRDFKSFNIDAAVAFKKHLAEQRNQQSGEKLSKATLYATLSHLKRFFQWLAFQSGYKSRLEYADAEYFNLSDKDTRIATTHREQRAPTVEQIKHTIASMPANTEIEHRNRALMAFTILTGARDSAIASMKLKHTDLVERAVYQDAREVKTKSSKTIRTIFFPVGKEIEEIVVDWVLYLRKEKLWGNDDPLFPATRIAVGESRQFEASGLGRNHWSSASRIREIFRAAFAAAGLPYFNPHSFRNTLVRLGEELCKTPEEFKAWSQNLGHEKVLTTFTSYGEVSHRRQGEIIRGLGTAQTGASLAVDQIAEALFKKLRDSGMEMEVS